ncbi:MAG: isoprenylcysteine carboxylmethyltransferase family protein [Anaerolineaceae bacterium]|nr:isoprenylcysteine carboxylmethyltransferase family protein [Anaerolineaceae bacterium]
MLTTIAAYLLIISFVVIEGRLRRGEKAKSMRAGESDRSSTGRLGLAFGLAFMLMLLAPLLDYFHIAYWAGSWFPGWLGVALMVTGITLRIWAARVLGRFYTRTLLTTTDQRIVEEGPYRLLRHPGYAGSLLVWTGAGLAACNWAVFLIITLTMGISYAYRMRSEEAMLLAQFGQAYRAYSQRTRRIIPFLY